MQNRRPRDEKDTRTWLSNTKPEIDARRPFCPCAARYEPYVFLHVSEVPGWEEPFVVPGWRPFSESELRNDDGEVVGRGGEWIRYPLFRVQTPEEYWAGVRETLKQKTD